MACECRQGCSQNDLIRTPPCKYGESKSADHILGHDLTLCCRRWPHRSFGITSTPTASLRIDHSGASLAVAITVALRS